MAAIRLLHSLLTLSEGLASRADRASPFTPRGTTLTVGQINGGTAVNILARECVFIFDLRTEPGEDPDRLLEGFMREAAAIDAELKARAPEAGVLVERRSLTPPFAPEADGAAEPSPGAWPATTDPCVSRPMPPRPGSFSRRAFPR
jgi:acetylornithine deacetylase